MRTLTSPKLAVSAAGLTIPNLLAMLAGVAALTLAAHVKIPFYPVPLTLQTLALLAMAFVLPWRVAAGAVALYLVSGHLFGTFAGNPLNTGGYLLGMLLAAPLISALLALAYRREDGVLYGTIIRAVAGAVGLAAVLGLGAVWLSVAQSYTFGVGLGIGVLQFLPGEALKLLLASLATAALPAPPHLRARGT